MRGPNFRWRIPASPTGARLLDRRADPPAQSDTLDSQTGAGEVTDNPRWLVSWQSWRRRDTEVKPEIAAGWRTRRCGSG